MEHVANHPALKQRHLYVGSGPPPDYDPDRTLMALSENADPHTQYVGKLSPDGSKVSHLTCCLMSSVFYNVMIFLNSRSEWEATA